MEQFGGELGFGLDGFQKQQVYDSNNSIARVLLNLLLMKPGNLPSLPHIGIDINKYLYVLEDDIDPDQLKNDIYNQCSELIPYLILGEVKVFVANYNGQGVLLINIPIQDTTNVSSSSILYGFTKDYSNGVTFNYELEQNLDNT